MSLYDDVLGAPDTASRQMALDALIAEQKEKDARIAENSASHSMASICHAQNIAELIRSQE